MLFTLNINSDFLIGERLVGIVKKKICKGIFKILNGNIGYYSHPNNRHAP